MSSSRDELKVGLTITVVLVLFVIVLVFIGQWNNFFTAKRNLLVRFDHRGGIQGLRVKDPVSVGGLNVGRVKKVWLKIDKIKSKSGRDIDNLFVYVDAEIPKNIKLRKDAKISIGTKFVGEGGSLEILDVGRKGKPVGSAYIFTGMPAPGIAQITDAVSQQLDENDPNSLISLIKNQLDPTKSDSLVAKVHNSLNDLNVISHDIRVQLDESQKVTLMAKIHHLVDNINVVTGMLRHDMDDKNADSSLAKIHLALDSMDAAMDSAKKILSNSQPKIASAVSHVEATAKRFDEKISVNISKELDRSDSASLIAQLHKSLGNIEAMTESGRELVAVNSDNIQAMIDNLSETALHLKATAKELRRHPWRLLYKPDQPEREYANLMESARAFSDAAGALDQANSKLSQMLKLHPNGIDPNDSQLIKIKESIKKTFCNFEKAQNKLWKLLKMKS